MKQNSASVVLAALLMVLLAPWGLKLRPKRPARATSDDVYKKVWKFAEWYKNDQNPVVQSLLFSGRFQYEYAHMDSDQGNNSEWNVRRMRLGAKSKLFQKLTLHGEVEFNPQERNPFYVRITDLYLQWTKSEEFALTSGQAGRPVHDGWFDVIEGIAHHRPEQPRQQHVVSPGVCSGCGRFR